MAMGSKNQHAIVQSIIRKQNFHVASMSGHWFDSNELNGKPVGMLPKTFHESLIHHNKTSDLFVVFSYNTPIAWYSLNDSDSDGTNQWHFPITHYSNTTSKHQNITWQGMSSEGSTVNDLLENK